MPTLLAFVALALGALLAIFAPASHAQAQGACDADVSSFAGLLDAVACHDLNDQTSDTTITLTSDFTIDASLTQVGGLTISNNSDAVLTIAGGGHTVNGPGDTIAGSQFDIFTIAGGANVDFEDITLRNADGSAIRVDDGTVTVTGTTLADNTLAGIRLFGGTTNIGASTITNNTNGVFATNSANVTISGGTIHTNTLNGVSGVGSATITVTGSTIHTNTLNGVFATNSANVTISGSTIHTNSHNGVSGEDTATITVTGSTIHTNTLEGVFGTQTATITITESTIRNNTLNGVWSQDTATITITGSTIHTNSHNGVFGVGTPTVTVTGSAIHTNTLNGVFGESSATITVTGSTIHTNTLNGVRGNGSAKIVVSNSTLHANAQDGALASGSSELWVANSTVTDNGNNGLRKGDGTATVASTILANNNTSGNGNGDCSGTIALDGPSSFSFDSDDTCPFASDRTLSANSLGAFAGNGCDVAIPSDGLNPPGTCPPVRPLLAGSNAIDAGACGNSIIGFNADRTLKRQDLLVDQRGNPNDPANTTYPRNGTGCDAGAVESDAPTCGSLDVDVSTHAALNDAIFCFNLDNQSTNATVTLTDDIAIDPNLTSGGMRAVTNASDAVLTIVGDNHTITGPYDPDDTTSDIAGQIDLFTITNGNVTFENMVLRQADASAIRVADGTVTASGVTMEDNQLAGIRLFGGATNIDASTITNNTNGINVEDVAIVTVTGSTIHTNTRNGVFGVGSATITVTGSAIHTNTLNGVYGQETSTITITGSSIHTNTLNGVFANGSAKIVVANSTLHANAQDGALALVTSELWVANSTVTDNGNHGLYKGNGTVTVASTILANNNTSGNGNGDCSGTIALDGPSSFSFDSDDTCPFASDRTLSANSLGAFAGNGCDVAIPSDGLNPPGTCPPVRPLLAGSNAIDAGACGNAIVGFNADRTLKRQDLLVDQRGNPNDPANTTYPRNGTGCDAGAVETSCSANTLTDVPAGAFYEAAVIWAACTGITTGTTPTTFSPNLTLNRAQMATFLWRHAGEPVPTGNHPFTDVPAGVFYEEPVTWLVEQGITTGTSPTTFSPAAPVTRAQMATFLWRYASEPLPADPNNPFTDVPNGAFYTTPVTWMAETGITTGTSPTTFAPNARLNRAQAVTFLLRYTNHLNNPN